MKWQGFGRQIKMDANSWQTRMNVGNWGTRRLASSFYRMRVQAATCAGGQRGKKRRLFIRHRHLAARAFLRGEDARSFLFRAVQPAQFMASDWLSPMR